MKSLLQFILEMEEEEKKNGTKIEPGKSQVDSDDDNDSDTDWDSDNEDSDEEQIDINGFIVLKPGFLDKEQDLRIRLEEAGWEIRGEASRTMTKEEAERFYEDKSKEPYYEDLVEYMSSDQSKCFMLWKEEAAKPLEELQNLKEKIRLEWSNDEMKNVLHSSATFDDMERELEIFLADSPEDTGEKEENKEDEGSEEMESEDDEILDDDSDENLLSDDEDDEDR